MGGGHLTRPDFGTPQADPDYPLTEFYLLLQSSLERAGAFALPALYAAVQAPARRIYSAEARQYLRLAAEAKDGYTKLLGAAPLNILYSQLRVAPSGAPAALELCEECTRFTCAVRLLPPLLWEDPLPPLPDTAAALSLQLTERDLFDIDSNPAALGARMVRTAQNKLWLHHPKADAFLAQKVALLQRVYK